MKTRVHSKDPRKPQIVAALKRRSGGQKITCVVELTNTASGDLLGNYFQGVCHKYLPAHRRYTELGEFTVTAKEAGLE